MYCCKTGPWHSCEYNLLRTTYLNIVAEQLQNTFPRHTANMVREQQFFLPEMYGVDLAYDEQTQYIKYILHIRQPYE